MSHTSPPEEGSFMRRFETHHKPVGRPLLWTFATSDSEDNFRSHIWLQNGLDQQLERITVENASMITVDANTFGSGADAVVYEHVLPGEAVYLDTYHLIYDSDYVLSTDILIERIKEPPLKLRLGPKKGGGGGILLRAPPAGTSEDSATG